MPSTPDFKERLAAIEWRNRAKEVHKPNHKWPTETWVECVSRWLVLGNLRIVAAEVGVPYKLLREWKTTQKWAEIEREVRASQIINLDTKLGQIVEKSLDAVLDRVENGDYIYDQKSGAIRRKPAALRDLQQVAATSITKQRDVRKDMVDRGDTGKISTEEHLKALAHEMAKWFKDESKKSTEVIDLVENEEGTYAVHEEWEEGLQEGEREVQLSPGSGEEAGGEEQSPSGTDEDGASPQG